MAEQPVLSAVHPAHAADIRMLLLNFKMKKSTDFKVFRSVWKEKTFSLIHEAKASDGENEADYVQSLYSTALGFFQLNQSLLLRLGCLYTLYLLYETQPQNAKRYKIKVSIALWRELARLYEDIKREKVVDAYHIFRKMRRDGYFALHAALRAMPSSTNTVRTTKSLDDLTTDTINTDTLTGVLDLDGLEAAATTYHTARARDESTAAGGALAGQGALGSELRSIVMQHERLKYTRSVSASAPPTDEPLRKPRAPQVGRGKKKSTGADSSAPEQPTQPSNAAGTVGGITRFNMENGEQIVQGTADLMNTVAVEHMPELGEFFAPEEDPSFGHRALKASDLEPNIDVSPMQHNHTPNPSVPLQPQQSAQHEPTDTTGLSPAPASAIAPPPPSGTPVPEGKAASKSRRASPRSAEPESKRMVVGAPRAQRVRRASAKAVESEAALEAASSESLLPERRSRSSRHEVTDY